MVVHSWCDRTPSPPPFEQANAPLGRKGGPTLALESGTGMDHDESAGRWSIRQVEGRSDRSMQPRRKACMPMTLVELRTDLVRTSTKRPK
eukprot:scaffold1322_cov372-Pavlova_lutheri.AAC.19